MRFGADTRRVIDPAIPGWVFLLFVALAMVGLLVLAVLVWGFVKSLYLAIAPGRDGGWRTPLVLGLVLAAIWATFHIARTDERALDDAVSEVIGISSLERRELRRFSSDEDPPCRRAVLSGPAWTSGAESRLLELAVADADEFERAGWDVARFVPSDLRRNQSSFGFAGWSFRATRDGRQVALNVDDDKWSPGVQYTVWAGECADVPPPDPTFVEPVPAYPDIPTDDVTAQDESALRDIVAAALVRGGPAIDHELVHGLGTDRDCFVASFSTDSSSSDDNDEFVDRLVSALDGPWESAGDGLSLGTASGSLPGWVVESTRVYGRGAIVRLYPPACVDLDRLAST